MIELSSGGGGMEAVCEKAWKEEVEQGPPHPCVQSHVLSSLPLFRMSLLLALLPQGVECQQSASLHVPLFTTDKNHSLRQNVCDREKNEDLDFRHGLGGLQLNIAAVRSEYFVYEDGVLNKEYPGLIAVLLDEIAERGNFTWRDSFAVYDGPGDDHTWTELLLFMNENFDLSADFWMKTIDRARLRILFPQGWMDTSYVFVANKTPPEKINLWNWVLPFQTDVWILIIFTLLWSGVVYMFLEYLASPKQYTGKRARETFGNDMYYSFLMFTQNFNFTPTAPASHIFAVSMALWALLIGSDYTANLANAYVDQSRQASSIEEAVQLGIPVCILDGTRSAIEVQTKYPAGKYIKFALERDLISGVKDGTCAAALTSRSSYEVYSRMRETNEDCGLHLTWGILEAQDAGFAVKSDLGTKCTSFVGAVVDLHLMEMRADGSLEGAWNDYYNRTYNHFCDDFQSQEEEEKSISRSLNEIAGTFVLHFAMSCFAIALGVITKFWKVYKNRSSTPVTQSELGKEGLKQEESGNKTAPPRTFLQDFWAETPSVKLRDNRIWTSCPRAMTAGGTLDSFQMLALLQHEIQQEQDKMEHKIQQQHCRLQDQHFRLQDQLTNLQSQLVNIVGIIKEHQIATSVRPTRVPMVLESESKSPPKMAPSNSTPPGVLITSVTEVKQSLHDWNKSERKQTHKASFGRKANQTSQLLQAHEKQELQGATAEYFDIGHNLS